MPSCPHQPAPRHSAVRAVGARSRKGLPAVLAILAFLTACGGTPQPVERHQPTSVTAPVIGYTTATPVSVAAYDEVAGDTILAFGDISAGPDPTLTLHLSQAESVPLDRFNLMAVHLPCSAGAVQPVTLQLAFVDIVQLVTEPGPSFMLVTPTSGSLPDLNVAVLANSDGFIRGPCNLTGQTVMVDTTFRQGWNWMRVPPRIVTDPFSATYWVVDAIPQVPGNSARWVDTMTNWLD